MKVKIVGVVCWLYALASFAVTSPPAIIPLPVQMQVRPGVFTLFPTPTSPGVPIHTTTQILVDSNSLATGQYLASMLFRSTGCQFQIATYNGSSAVKNGILLTTANAIQSLGSEGYELTVAPDSVLIRAPAQAGVFYGVQSLLQLLPPQILSLTPVSGVSWTAPCVYIQDQPRFSWRGYMMDESRHFFGKQEVKKFMDAMALQKMNTFHWHLVDDEGWRIQILAYPLLTTTGAWRPGWGTAQNNGIDFGQNPRVSSATNSAGQYGGFYTQDDIREIIAYATARHITIVPEIEMPSHNTAGLASYPQFGCGNDVTNYIMDVNSQQNVKYSLDLFSLGTNTASTNAGFPFLEQVLTEVMNLFPGQYIHCGGDEVVSVSGSTTNVFDTQWQSFATDANQMAALGITGTSIAKTIAYQHWFTTNMANFIQAHGHTMIGWTETTYGGPIPNAAVMDWQTGATSMAVASAEAGQKVVMAPNVGSYINYYMSRSNNIGEHPEAEPYFNSSSQNTLSNVYSLEPVPASLPSQYATNILGAECPEWAEYIPSTRNEEFKAFPRLCAMAEVTWTPAASKNYANFVSRLATHEQRLAAMGMNYDATNAISVGTWGPTVSTSHTLLTYDITSFVTNAGDINLDFHYTSGANAINIYSVALLVNGTQVDEDNTGYIGFAGLSPNNLPYFVVHLKSYQPGATYTIQPTIAGVGGTASSGTIFIVNWN